MSYYYKENHLYRYYAILNNKQFKTREEYENYCLNNNIELFDTYVARKSKYFLERDDEGLYYSQLVKIALNTYLYDSRDLSKFYFKDEEDANEFLKYYKEGSSRWAVECLFDGCADEPDYSPDGIVNSILEKGFEIKDFNPEMQMKKIAHFIISYLPDDENKRQKRKDAHHKQIKSIKAITPNAKIHIVAQNYKEEDYIKDPQIEYQSFGKLGVVKARNQALQWFYNSDYDFCIINDDDVFLKPTDSSINFFEEIENNTKKFKDFDVIYSRDMYHNPLQASEVQYHEDWNKNWCFTWVGSSVLHWTIIRNFKKYYGVEEYQDETIDSTKGEGYDDADFGYYLNSKGYKIWQSCNALQSYAQSWYLKNSSLYEECTENPWTRLMNNKKDIKKWLGWDKNGTIDIEGFRKRTNHHSKHKKLLREKEVDVFNEFTERNAPELTAFQIAIERDREYNI